MRRGWGKGPRAVGDGTSGSLRRVELRTADGGQIAEQSVDWFGEDKQGNVWDLGSYTESYEGGQFVNASDARRAGIKGSKPAIIMRAHPRVGDEWFEAKAVKTGQKKCVPCKCYKDVAGHPGGIRRLRVQVLGARRRPAQRLAASE
jgi:hypothetical protein